jgi:hypothetical protein
MEHTLRRAPPGFSADQWVTFEREGFVMIENVLDDETCTRYADAIWRMARSDSTWTPDRHFGRQNLVSSDPVFEDLIDRDSHIGFAYDLYGELTKVHLSHAMLRPRGGWYNLWHPDGPRALPYRVFSPELPLQLKIGYWLSDVPQPRMGNLVVFPGSHRSSIFDAYDTHESIPGELITTPRRGSMLVMNANLWHRVEPNDTDQVRVNIFMTYSPSWIVSEDRHTNDPTWLATLPRERRILMRSYRHPYDNAKPPASDFPLFLDRDSGADRDPDAYRNHVELHRRKRLTTIERLQASTTVPR